MILRKDISSLLNFARWFSAFMVFLHHFRNYLFTSYDLIEHKTVLTKIFYFFTLFGHEAVIVFFILSGLFVGGGWLSSMRNNQENLKKYLIDRLTRLYIVLIPSLFLALFFALILIDISNTREVSLSIKDFFGSLLFLQTILTEPFAHNGPLWSLANEFWYYMLFPLLTFIYYNKKRYLAFF